nr:hypothetical protein B0A51_14039 [Rachicladosporium sp. CCFEE 5018]
MAAVAPSAWLAGLPETEVLWDAAPAVAPTTPIGSIRSTPGSVRTRSPKVEYDTVQQRSAPPKMSGPKTNHEWQKRLMQGNVTYGEQTDLFAAPALENMFSKPAKSTIRKSNSVAFKRVIDTIAEDVSATSLASDDIAKAEGFSSVNLKPSRPTRSMKILKRQAKAGIAVSRADVDVDESQGMLEAALALEEDLLPEIRIQSASVVGSMAFRRVGSLAGKRPPPSPGKDATPKRRRTAPAFAMATGDYMNEAKQVLNIIRSSESPQKTIKTLDQKSVAHLIGGEVKGMTYDAESKCWVRAKSAQFLKPNSVASSDTDPFGEISDLTTDHLPRGHVARKEAIGQSELSFGDAIEGTVYKEDGTSAETAVRHSEDESGCSSEVIDDTLALYQHHHTDDPSTVEIDEPADDANIAAVSLLPLHSSKGEQSSPVTPQALTRQVLDIFELSSLADFTIFRSDGAPSNLENLKLELLSVLIEAVGHVGEDIRTLNLAAKELKSLHGLIEYCPEVEELDVSDNALTQLDGIPSTACRSLCAKGNQLDDVTYFGHLTDLECLDVSENSLTDLDGLADLHRLKELKCAANRLTFVDFRDTPFPCLESLDLSKNQITQAAGLDALPNLISLTLDNNTMPSILDVLPVMPCLESLSLRSCGIHIIPSDLHTRLPALRHLVLDGNPIADIRPLSHVPSLEHLSLASCQISRLRQTVFTLRLMNRLTSIDLRSNPLTHGFYDCPASQGILAMHTVDGEIAVRRTVYEALLAGCLRKKGVVVDGNVMVEKDRSGIWERLVELDVVGKGMARTEQQ